MSYLRVKNELPLIPGYSEGAIAYAPDAADAPLNECICYINPEQSGSGDPSPSNVRPITGHTELNLVQKDGNDTVVHTYTTDFGTTVYGGTLDVESGVLTLTHKYMICSKDNQTWNKSSTYDGSFFVYVSTVGFKSSNPFICSHLASLNSSTGYAYGKCFSDSALNLWIMASGSSLDDFKNYLDSQIANGTPVTICGELAEPITIQLTPQEVKSLLGSNNFYHDCNGDTKITYIRRLDS